MHRLLLCSLLLLTQTWKSAASSPQQSSSNYKLGPDDEIIIYARDADDLSNKKYRIERSGDLNLPTPLGRIYAAGMTVEELSETVAKKLSAIIKFPDVQIRVESPRSQPVLVLGAVSAPGEVQLEGGKSLLSVLTKVGWLRNDAGSKIKITRLIENGPIPLPSAVSDERFSVAEVSVMGLQNGERPEENIQLMPHDVIAVQRADIVYVIGGIRQPGGYALNENKAISLIALLGQAHGTTPTAKLNKATLYRRLPEGNHTRIEVDISEAKKLKPGKEIMLQANDILDIPDSLVKGTLQRTFEQAVSAITGAAIYRPF